MKKAILTLHMVLFSVLIYGAEKPDIKAIINHIDRIYRSDTSYSEMEMIVETPHWKRSMKMKAWSQGMKKTFITVLSPKKDRGISTLRKDKQMWNYFPKINKVMKIPPSMMMGSWMGSDFTNDDFVKESSMIEDYDSSFASPPESDSEFFHLRLVPKKQTASVWGRIVIKARKKDYIPVQQTYYDEKEKKMRVIYLSDIRKIGGKMIPAMMELIPLNKKGHRTKIIYKDAKFNIKLKKDVFTLRNLQKKR